MLGIRKKKDQVIPEKVQAGFGQDEETGAENGGSEASIQASILSFADGLAEYENVDLIRVKSRRYNLLILKDYMPVLGELDDARVEIVTEGQKEVYNNVNGYFIHADNRFELLITEDDYVE